MGANLPPGLRPPRRHQPSKNDWTPYASRAEFELADLLYTREQMPAGKIDDLLNIWAATLAPYNGSPPFTRHTDLYSTIDTTLLGDVKWDSHTFHYNHKDADQPSDPPAWHSYEYNIFFRNPRKLVQNLLSNPDFVNDFDYSPLQEYDLKGNHRFHNFMSGNWAWKEAVSK